jgi:hypothetical protein
MAGSQERTLEDVSTDRRIEPRRVTLADTLAIVAGFGVAIALRPVPYLPPPSMGIVVPIWFVVIWWSIGLLLTTALATAFAIVVRQLMFRRPARPAEWVAVLLGLMIFREALPNIDDMINQRFSPDWLSRSFGLCRWIVGGIGAVMSLVCLAVLGLLRRMSPHGFKTIILAAAILALLWGPIRVFSMEFPWLIPSPPIESTPAGVFWAWLEIRKYLGLLPLGLLFGIPATAALEDRRARTPRGRLWTEWPGPGISLILVFSWLVYLYLVQSEWPPFDLNAERVVVPFWIAGVWWLCRWIVNRLGDRWQRWLTPIDP